MPSDLPILPADPPSPPPRSAAEKYGGLYTLGIVGLIVLVGLIAWFGLAAWSLRSVWRDVYILHDPGRPEAERVDAAYRLSRNPRVTQRQYWDIALRRDLPPLARYLMAESLTAGAVAPDPRGYAVAAARSEGWPGWFRLLVARPMAYAAGDLRSLPPDILAELYRQTPDPFLRVWMAYTLAALGTEGAAAAPDAAEALRAAADSSEPFRPLAQTLRDALGAHSDRRFALLDRATLWLRSHHPEAVAIWAGWRVEGERIVPAN